MFDAAAILLNFITKYKITHVNFLRSTKNRIESIRSHYIVLKNVFLIVKHLMKIQTCLIRMALFEFVGWNFNKVYFEKIVFGFFPLLQKISFISR